jgi:hypothetical protein
MASYDVVSNVFQEPFRRVIDAHCEPFLFFEWHLMT